MWRTDSYCSVLRSVVDVLRPIRGIPVSVTVADSDAKHNKPKPNRMSTTNHTPNFHPCFVRIMPCENHTPIPHVGKSTENHGNRFRVSLVHPPHVRTISTLFADGGILCRFIMPKSEPKSRLATWHMAHGGMGGYAPMCIYIYKEVEPICENFI